MLTLIAALTLAAVGGYAIFAMIAIGRTEPPEW